jgi:hypothetical protein
VIRARIAILALTAATAGWSGVCTAGPAAEPAAAPPTAANAIDDLVFAHLARLGIAPAAVSSDAVFVRRAFLDVIGTLPTADEARTFITSRDPAKRRVLIDRLLEREEFADYWAMKWSDLLRVKSEFPINLWPNAVQAYHRWIRARLRDNTPYDQFARRLLTASGSSFREPPANFYRAVQNREPAALAQAVALTFMGARTERWPVDRVSGMAVFFSRVSYKSTKEWKEEIVFFDPHKGTSAPGDRALQTAVFPDGTTTTLQPDRDPREVFAEWLISPANPWFTKNIANRVWSWLLGRGVVHEADDVRPDNPPSHPELLALLERELVAARYDLKHLYRFILNSRTYQLSSSLGSDEPPADAAAFSRYPMRSIDAEVLIDAICQVTGTTEEYSSAIPEPFTFTPERQRAVLLADGSMTSTFLETFGRPARDTGLESERTPRATAAGRLHLLNSSHIQRKVETSRTLLALIQARANLGQAVTNLYLTILSRFPTEAEVQAAASHVQSAGNRRTALLDLAWALINSVEFLYRH